MRVLSFFILLFIVQIQAQDLEDYLWKNRVVLLFSENKEELQKQIAFFDDQKRAVIERDMVILKGKKDAKQKLGLPTDFQGVALIGKDGGLKFSEPFFVKPVTIFTLIDGMPMRRAEMQRQKNKY